MVAGAELRLRRSLILRQLTRRLRLSALPPSVEAQIHALDLQQLEALSEALLDFAKLVDLTAWLRVNG